jgi:hypothetical protein
VRHQDGVPGNMRRISSSQLSYLKDLIGADPEGASFVRDAPGVWLWTPSGRSKYRIKEDFAGNRHSIERLQNLTTSGAGRLF